MGMGHKKRYMCHMQKSITVAVSRVHSQSAIIATRALPNRMGSMQPCLPLPLHFKMATVKERLPYGQFRVGLPEDGAMSKYQSYNQTNFILYPNV